MQTSFLFDQHILDI